MFYGDDIYRLKERLKNKERKLENLENFVLNNLLKYKKYDHVSYICQRDNVEKIGTITSIFLDYNGNLAYRINDKVCYEYNDHHIIRKCSFNKGE